MATYGHYNEMTFEQNDFIQGPAVYDTLMLYNEVLLTSSRSAQLSEPIFSNDWCSVIQSHAMAEDLFKVQQTLKQKIKS